MSNVFNSNDQDQKPSIWGVVLKIVIYAAGVLAAYFGINAAAHAIW